MKIKNALSEFLIIIFIIIIFKVNSFSQNNKYGEDFLDSTILLNARVIESYTEGKDTVLKIAINEIVIFPPHIFKTEKEKTKYTKLMYNVKKVYPYAKLIDIEYDEIENTVASMESDSEIRKYLKEKEKELMTQFEEELRDLTFSQGRILIKLVDRETGNTTYEVVKEFKGNLSAMFWQSIALMFSSSLKYEYDENEEDKWIEEIIILIENGQI